MVAVMVRGLVERDRAATRYALIERGRAVLAALAGEGRAMTERIYFHKLTADDSEPHPRHHRHHQRRRTVLKATDAASDTRSGSTSRSDLLRGIELWFSRCIRNVRQSLAAFSARTAA